MGRCGTGSISSFEWPTSALDLQDAAGLPQVAAMQERLGFQSTSARSVLPPEPGMVHDKRQNP
jgi:hypothetical protein